MKIDCYNLTRAGSAPGILHVASNNKRLFEGIGSVAANTQTRGYHAQFGFDGFEIRPNDGRWFHIQNELEKIPGRKHKEIVDYFLQRSLAVGHFLAIEARSAAVQMPNLNRHTSLLTYVNPKQNDRTFVTLNPRTVEAMGIYEFSI
ncbi:MAG: hypothetical protein ACI8Y7_000756 [Candidatus Woesearchaeota archaeon]|jgi:hypothetical protein